MSNKPLLDINCDCKTKCKCLYFASEYSSGRFHAKVIRSSEMYDGPTYGHAITMSLDDKLHYGVPCMRAAFQLKIQLYSYRRGG